MMNKERFQQLKEDDLVDEVLIPLFWRMEYRDVFKHHGGAGEKGKDIVFWQSEPIGGRKNYAVVAKAVKLSGQAKVGKGTAAEIVMQVRQCFGNDYLDPVTAEPQKVHECWVVSNKEIPKEAVDAISGAIGADFARNTRFLYGDKLWHLVEKHLLPITSLLEQANKSINTLDSHYKPVITLTGDETVVTLQEKFPGAAKEKPINIQAKLVFPPNDPAGENARKEFKNLIEKGTPATIPAQFIEAVEIPEFARALLGNIRFEEMSLQLSSLPTDKIIPVKIDFISDDQDICALNYVPLKLIQSGTKQLMFTNDEADQIVRIELILDLEDRVGRINFRIYWDDLNAVQLLENLTLQKCLSKPVSINIIGLETGINLFKMDGHSKFFEPPEPDLVDMVSDLAMIQKKIKRPIVFPIRDLSEDEWKTIQKLRQILKEGTIKGTWDNLKTTIIPSSEGLKSLLAQGETGALRFTSHEVETLFNTELPLGPVETIFQFAKLVNFQEIQDRYEELKSGDKEIELNWISGEDNNSVVTNYLNWMPGVKPSP